jgi:hypothetical protein
MSERRIGRVPKRGSPKCEEFLKRGSGASGIGANFDVGWLVMMTFVTGATCSVPLYERGIKGDFQYLRQKSPLPPFTKGGNPEAS